MSDDQIYDIVIVGGGPAGLSAAVNGRIRQIDTLVISSEEASYRLSRAPKVDNYPGIPEVTGAELCRLLRNHARSLGAEIRRETVNGVMAQGDVFGVSTDKGFYMSRSVVLATGMPVKASVEGEERLLGHGVAYCATCDGPLYRSKKVAVLAYTKESMEEVEYLATLASSLYFFPIFAQGDTAMIPQLRDEEGAEISVITGKPLAVLGSDLVAGLRYSSDGGEREIEVDGVFIIRPAIPMTRLVPGLEMEGAAVRVDRGMATNIRGVFAAGDCAGDPWQVSKAAGEGQVAALSAVRYLSDVAKKQRG